MDPADATDAEGPDNNRRFGRRWAIALAGVALIAAALGTVHVIAWRAFDDAASTAEDLVDSGARAGLATAANVAAGVMDLATETLAEVPDRPDTRKPLWTWDLAAASSRLVDDSAALDVFTVGLDAVTAELETTTEDLQNSASTLYASVPAAAQTMLGSGAELAFTAYATAAHSLKTSQQAELAEKAGPLLTTRLAIEGYAHPRSGTRDHLEMQRSVRLVRPRRERGVGDGVGNQHGAHRSRQRRAGVRLPAGVADRDGCHLPLSGRVRSRKNLALTG